MKTNKKIMIFGLVIVAIAAVGISANIWSTSSDGQIIVRQSGGTGSLIEECGNRSYITETVDYIIEGTVEHVESRWDEAHTDIFTYTDLRIETYVKGTPFQYDTLQIVTPGGTVGDLTSGVEDQPIFHEGKRVRIYFVEENGEFSIFCGQMGVEEL